MLIKYLEVTLAPHILINIFKLLPTSLVSKFWFIFASHGSDHLISSFFKVDESKRIGHLASEDAMYSSVVLICLA